MLFVVEWARWVEVKMGFWIMDLQGLQTQMQVMIDFISRHMRIWVDLG